MDSLYIYSTSKIYYQIIQTLKEAKMNLDKETKNQIIKLIKDRADYLQNVKDKIESKKYNLKFSMVEQMYSINLAIIEDETIIQLIQDFEEHE